MRKIILLFIISLLVGCSAPKTCPTYEKINFL